MTGAQAPVTSRASSLRRREEEKRSPDANFLLWMALAGVGAVGYADWVLKEVSLGLLYLLPLTLGSMTGRAGYAYPLAFLCLILREWLGPFDRTPGLVVARSSLAAIGFFFLSWLTVRRSRQRLRQQHQIESQRAELARELELAAETQRLLLPQAPPRLPGYRLAAGMFPAKVVGGDYYSFFSRGDDRLDLAIGDVSGKGVGAAMLMPALGTALGMSLEGDPDPVRLLAKVDRGLYETTNLARYATLFYAQLYAGERRLVYCNAGHPPPLLFRGDQAAPLWLSTGGRPVGLLPYSSFESETIRLRSGDVLVMYTDGVTDSENRAGEPFGPERLESLVRGNRTRSADSLLQAMRAELEDYREGASQADDSTIIVLEVL